MERPKYIRIKVNKEWIKKNILKPIWQRNVYQSRVNKFKIYIKEDNFKNSLITVAKDNKRDKLILLDGQHKLKAIEESDTCYEMDFAVYNNLNEEQMKEIYTMLNDVKSPRLIDDIKLYIGKNEYLDLFMSQKYFPINITFNGGVNSLRIDRFLNILWNGLRPLPTMSNMSRGKLKTFLDSLTSQEAGLAKDFFEFYKCCYGNPSNDNWMYKNNIGFTIMRIWIVNKGLLNNQELIRVFRPIESNAIIRQIAGRNDKGGIVELTRQVYRFINKGRSTNKFILYWDEDILIEDLSKK